MSHNNPLHSSKLCNHSLRSSIMIIYLEAVLSVHKSMPAALQGQAVRAALAGLHPQHFWVLQESFHLSPNSLVDWLTAALLRRPLVWLPVAMQKSPSTSLFPCAMHQESVIGWNQENKPSCHHGPLIEMLQCYSHKSHRSFMLLLLVVHTQHTDLHRTKE